LPEYRAPAARHRRLEVGDREVVCAVYLQGKKSEESAEGSGR